MSANNPQQQDGLFDGLFDKPEPQADPIWGDRFIKKDRAEANQKPYGRPDNPIRQACDMTFDIEAARRERDDAVDRGDQNADQAWKDAFFAALVHVARSEESFSTDEVWERLSRLPVVPQTRDNRSAGAVVMRAKREGIIKMTDRTISSRMKHCHGKLTRVYQSLIYGQQGDNHATA